jgi:protein-tyrosine phosphatase
LAVTPMVWPWGVFLLWPAAALALVAAGYFGVGPGIYRKTEGRLPLSTWFVKAPVLLGQWLSLVYYRRQCRAWDEAAPGVWLGRQLSAGEAADAVRQGVTAVLDLTAEFAAPAAFLAVRYYNLPILDLTAPTQQQLHEAVTFITEEAERGTVYIHCKIGYSRSAAVVGAYLMASGRAGDAEEAIDLLRRIRPALIVRPEAEQATRAFAGATCVTANVS